MTGSRALFIAAAIGIVAASLALLNGPLLSVVLRVDSWSQSWEMAWTLVLVALVIAASVAIRFAEARIPTTMFLAALLVAAEVKLFFYGYVTALYPRSSLPLHFSILSSCLYVAVWSALVFVYVPRRVALGTCGAATLVALVLTGYSISNI